MIHRFRHVKLLLLFFLIFLVFLKNLVSNSTYFNEVEFYGNKSILGHKQIVVGAEFGQLGPSLPICSNRVSTQLICGTSLVN